MLRVREYKTTLSPSVQSNSQESSQLRGHRGVETVAQTKETHKHINVTYRNEEQMNHTSVQQLLWYILFFDLLNKV